MPFLIDTSTEQKTLQALIKRRHPCYEELASHWEFCDQCYEGGREWFEANIFKYMKEGDTEYKARVARAYRFNHTREIVSLVTKYIFKEGAHRNLEDAPDSLKRFWKSSTRAGQPIDAMMRRVSDLSSLHGRCWILVDSVASLPTVTIEDEKLGNARIYGVPLPASAMLDFARDPDGKLSWALLRMTARDDADPLESTGAVYWRYLLISTEQWIWLEVRKNPKTGKLVIFVDNQGVNEIGEVPLVMVDHIETDDPFEAPSLVQDIVYLDRAATNYLSNLDAIIQDQTFSQLVMPAQGMMSGSDEYKTLMEMGTKRLFIYDGEAGSPPSYISPDPRQAQLILEAVNKIISEIYHSVGMAGERTKQDNAMGIDNSSGVAKAYDFERMNALLSSKAEILDRAENEVVRLVGLIAGEKPSEADLVVYPKSFDVRGLYDEFEIGQNLLDLNAPRSLRRAQMTTIADKMMPVIGKVQRAEIDAELKNWPPEVPVVDPLAPKLAKPPSVQGQNTGKGDPKDTP